MFDQLNKKIQSNNDYEKLLTKTERMREIRPTGTKKNALNN